MSYITAEQIREKRNAIKAAFPGWKFSITRKHHSTIKVVILQADIMLTDKPSVGVNTFYIKDHYKDKPEVMQALLTIHNIMDGSNETVQIDGDYGAIPQFYTDLDIGEWDKPFVCSKV